MAYKIRFYKTSLCSQPSINMKSNGKMKDSFQAILFWLDDLGNPNLLLWQWKDSIIMITEGKVGYPYPIHCTNKQLLTITTFERSSNCSCFVYKKGSSFGLKSAIEWGELWQSITSKLAREENTFYYLDNISITSSSMKLLFDLHFPSPQLLIFLNFLSCRFLDSIWSISKAPQKMAIWTDHTHELLGRPKVYKGLFWDAILRNKN